MANFLNGIVIITEVGKVTQIKPQTEIAKIYHSEAVCIHGLSNRKY